MIPLKSQREIDIMRRGGKVLAQAIELVEKLTEPGRTTLEIDSRIDEFVRDNGGTPTFKGYHGFPNCCCISINEQLVHGIPGDRVIRNGDIVSYDIGITLDNYITDSATTVAVGEVSDEAHRLVEVTRTSLDKAIAVVRPGVRLSEIGRAVQTYVEANGFSVVRKFVGHGVGRNLWEEPQIPNFWDGGSDHDDRSLPKGAVIAIEPMVNAGTPDVKTLPDKWTVVTKDGKLCAHFEHTMAITEDGCEVLTQT